MPSPDAQRPQRRVLVVDDDELVLGMMARTLGRSGMEVTAIACPEAALGLLRDPREQVDVMLTDVVMPKIDGFSLAEHARRHRPELPVLFTSGFMAPSQEARKPSDARLLAKPFTADELVDFVAD